MEKHSTLGINMSTADTEFTWADVRPVPRTTNPLNERKEQIWKLRDRVIDARMEYGYSAEAQDDASALLMDAINAMLDAVRKLDAGEQQASDALLDTASSKISDAWILHFERTGRISHLLDSQKQDILDGIDMLLGRYEEEQYPKSLWDVM